MTTAAVVVDVSWKLFVLVVLVAVVLRPEGVKAGLRRQARELDDREGRLRAREQELGVSDAD